MDKPSGAPDSGAEHYRKFLQGDNEALALIIRDYKDGLILYLNGIVHNIHDAEELMEETFVKLAVKKPRFKADYSFKTWLYTVGRNCALDCLRRSAKTVGAQQDLDSAAEKTSLEESYIKQEEKIILHRAIDRLNPDYAQVLYLSYFEGFDNAQTAAVMKKSRRQVENLLYRAKGALRAELEKENFIYEGL